MKHGVDATRLERVAAAAGVSKVTLYSHFHDKPALFTAVLHRHMARIRDEQASGLAEGDLRSRLIGFGGALMRFVLSDDAVRFDAMLSRDIRRDPALAALFWEAGPGPGLAALEALLAAAAATGELAFDSAADAAEDLVGLWFGMQLKRGLLAQGGSVAGDRRVERGVDLFLRLYGQ